jgi:crossover junction endodeoxyribonuclease RuvC
MRIAGIDPGLKGGLALLGDDVAEAVPMPTLAAGKTREIDCAEVMAWLFLAEPDLVILERVHAMPASYTDSQGKTVKTQGITSTFNFGMGYGMVRGVLHSLAIPHKLILPRRWKDLVLQGLPHDKTGAIQFTQNNYPSIDLQPGRCRTPQDGLADAVCLAHFGVQQYAVRGATEQSRM